MADDQIKNWGEWNRKWQRTITSQSPFEWNFAQKVIQKVPGLSPNNVTPQQSFVGNDGRQRHMDFAIEVDDVKIAIEVEGWDKTGENRGKNKQEHDEFNRRIQSLESQGWRVLTVTNAQFMADPAHYATHIRQLILQGPKAPQNTSSQEAEPEEKQQDLEQRSTTNSEPHEKKVGKGLLVFSCMAALIAIGATIWVVINLGESDTVELTRKAEPIPEPIPEPTPVPEEDICDEGERVFGRKSLYEGLSAEDFQEMYILKDGGNVYCYIDFEAVTDELDCDSLGNDQKPVFLPNRENDLFHFDSVGLGDGWGCTKDNPIPDYFTQSFEANDNSWHFQFEDEYGKPIDLTDENVRIICENVPDELVPIYLPDKENDPYDLDGRGNIVDNGVAC
tara:strand:- start:45 stop:1217 length:1173 start_codon:yes stop_codon:yes gene_type:complete